MKFFILTLLAIFLTPYSYANPSCPGRNLNAFKMSSVLFQGQRVKPFLLNTKGEKYIPCSGQEVLLPNESDRIIVGVEKKLRGGNTQIIQVDYSKLLRDSANATQAPTSRIELPSIEGEPQNNQDQLETKERTLNLIHQFNQNSKICQAINQSDFRLKTMLENWKAFCKASHFKTECQRAMEVDMLSRTIAFEAHPLGMLDNIAEVLNTPISKFRVSTCERVYIGVTLRNRKFKGGKVEEEELENLKSRRLSKKELLSYSPYFHDGLDGAKYNIWRNEHVKRSYITACFSEKAKLPEVISPTNSYNYRVFKRSYLATIANTYDTLFKQVELDAKMAYINSQTQQSEDVHRVIKHYYHPRAMPKCFYAEDDSNWKIRRNASGVVACRQVILSNGKEVRDCALIKNEPHRLNEATGEIQWVHSNKKDRNLKYSWTENEPYSWQAERILAPSQARLYHRIENERGHTYSDLNRRRLRYCETYSNPSSIGNLAPDWALHEEVPRLYTIECKLDQEEAAVQLGGLRDPRIAPVVTDERKTTPMISPINKIFDL